MEITVIELEKSLSKVVAQKLAQLKILTFKIQLCLQSGKIFRFVKRQNRFSEARNGQLRGKVRNDINHQW